MKLGLLLPGPSLSSGAHLPPPSYQHSTPGLREGVSPPRPSPPSPHPTGPVYQASSGRRPPRLPARGRVWKAAASWDLTASLCLESSPCTAELTESRSQRPIFSHGGFPASAGRGAGGLTSCKPLRGCARTLVPGAPLVLPVMRFRQEDIPRSKTSPRWFLEPLPSGQRLAFSLGADHPQTPADVTGRCRRPVWNPFLRTGGFAGRRWVGPAGCWVHRPPAPAVCPWQPPSLRPSDSPPHAPAVLSHDTLL